MENVSIQKERKISHCQPIYNRQNGKCLDSEMKAERSDLVDLRLSFLLPLKELGLGGMN